MLLFKWIPFVAMQSLKYNIDATHGMAHSMNTLYYADKIFCSEVAIRPELAPWENVVYTSAFLHDMCDGKYMDKDTGVQELRAMMKDKMSDAEVDAVLQIVGTMSYSYIQENGFPEFPPDLQAAYHIVREADLLTSYEVDRSILYHLHKMPQPDMRTAFANANELFAFRVLTLRSRNYFTTKVGKQESEVLEPQAMERLLFWKRMLSQKGKK